MRILDGNIGMESVAKVNCDEPANGEETHNFTLPYGMNVTSELESNNSTTFRFYRNGQPFYVWNSGTFVSCFLIGAGVGGIVTGFTGMPALGGLATFLATQGCQNYVNKTLEDGDTYIPPC